MRGFLEDFDKDSFPFLWAKEDFFYTMNLDEFFFAIFWAAPMAYGGSQARGLIRAVAASLHQSHRNSGSEPHLQPTPQLTVTLDC